MENIVSLFAGALFLPRTILAAVLGTSLPALATDLQMLETKGAVVEIRTSGGTVQGKIAAAPLLIVEEEEERQIVYRVTADAIQSIAHGKITFYNQAAGRWIVSGDLPEAEVAAVLTAIEEGGTPASAADKVYWLPTKMTNPQWLEIIKHVTLERKWHLIKATPLTVLDATTGEGPTAVEVKDIIELKSIPNSAP
jgi:hypothetical protein